MRFLGVSAVGEDVRLLPTRMRGTAAAGQPSTAPPHGVLPPQQKHPKVAKNHSQLVQS